MQAEVIAEWKVTYPDPLTAAAGEVLSVGGDDPEWPGWRWCRDPRGKQGWVPEVFLSPDGRIDRDYTARELAVTPGEEVDIEREVAGWIWCRKDDGTSGWMPAKNVAR